MIAVTVGPALPVRAAGEGARGGPGQTLHLVDATGAVVGPVHQVHQSVPPYSAATTPGPVAQVSVRLGDRTVVLWASRERFLTVPLAPLAMPGNHFLAFDLPNCTGNRFLVSLPDQPLYAERLVPLYAIGPGQRLYVAAGPPQPLAAATTFSEPFEACAMAGAVTGVPAVEIADLDALFPPPYHVE